MFRLIVVLSVLSVLCLVSGDANVTGDASRDRVVMGRGATCSEFPYQVSLQQDGNHFCGGSILNTQWILTAAHCLDDTTPQQIPGLSVRMGTSTRESGGTLRAVELVVVHPYYIRANFRNDCALAKVLGQIIYSAVIKPVKIHLAAVATGVNVILTGWGKVHDRNPNPPIQMQMATMKALTPEVCGSSRYSHRPNTLFANMMCATGELTGAGSCQGDSGGPLVLESNLCQCGIVSWGQVCADPAVPGVYARLSDPIILAFIRDYVGDGRFSTC